MSNPSVSRSRYNRLLRALEEAEQILEQKSRELFDSNEEIKKKSAAIEKLLEQRTQELDVSQAQLFQAFTFAPNAILTLDAGGNIMSISKFAEEWFDIPAAKLVGNRMFQMFDNHKELIAQTKYLFRPEYESEIKVHPQRTAKDGRVLIFEASARRVNDRLLPYAIVVSLRDVTAEMNLEAEKAKVAEIVDAFMDAGPVYYALEDSNYRIVAISEASANKFFGTSPSKLVGKDIADLGFENKNHVWERRKNEAELLNKNDEITIHFSLSLSGQRKKSHLRSHIKIIPRTGGDYYRSIVTEDVTELDMQRRFNAQLLNRTPSIILTQNENWKILSCSDAWTEQLGFTRKETLGHDLVEFMHPEDVRASSIFRASKLKTYSDQGVIKNSLRFLTKQNDCRTFELQSVTEAIEGELLNIVTLVDITEITLANEQLKKLAYRDDLTGLLSRRGMNERFADAHRQRNAGLFIIDVDYFKSVNDSFGHHSGDELLKAYGKTLERATKLAGCAVRLGGEEFAVIRPWKNWDEAYDFAENIRLELGNTSVEHNDHLIRRTASIGFSELPKDGSLANAMKLADMMQIEAKQSGRDKVVGSDRKMLDYLQERGAFITIAEVQTALELGEFCYYVQPIWNAEDEVIEGFEGLIRWVKPDGRVITPEQFLGPLIAAIRDPSYLARKVQLRKEAAAHLWHFPKAYISFNYRLEQLAYVGAAIDVHEQLQSIKDHPNRQLVIELSEAGLDGRFNLGTLAGELQTLKNFGYLIALDDFGVESSNIYRSLNFPIDIIKIDKSIISEVHLGASKRSILDGLILMFKGANFKLIAEGVETKLMAEILLSRGISSHQGYLHAKPMPPDKVIHHLDQIGARAFRP